MRHNNISIFIPHAGCKNMCSFCDQKMIAGTKKPPELFEVRAVLEKAVLEISDKTATEIAFFGGSFTAIPREMMEGYLKIASEFLGVGGFSGIRLSTRPDAIDEDILTLLKKYGVTAVELGAQSMDDAVLSANNRGHSAQAVSDASGLIKKFGFSLVLQMMTGLYCSSPELDEKTAERLIECKPDAVRIYPTVVLHGTELEQLYLSGRYTPLSLDEAVLLCSKLLLRFYRADISVIKLGLHASTEVEESMVCGVYHPAFRELCENEIYFELAVKELKMIKGENVTLFINERNISKLVGQRKKNMEKFLQMGYNISIDFDNSLKKYEVYGREG